MARPRQAAPTDLAKVGLRAAGIAHDLAQPLTAALLAARQVAGKGAPALRESLHRMEDLLLALREEVSPAATRRPRGPADLAAIQRNLRAGLTPAERRRTRLRLAGTCSADALAVQRIVGNLVLNALRHGIGAVSATGHARGRRLSVCVTGEGKRADQPGWGIGLASCQDLAATHGLELRVEISPLGSKATLATRT